MDARQKEQDGGGSDFIVPTTPNAHSLTVTKTPPWERLPYELRQKIFALLDNKKFYKVVRTKHSDRSSGYFYNVPPLVIALRSLPLSYSHVLEWFGKYNTHLRLYEPNFGMLSDDEVAVINSVYVNVP